MEAVAKDIRHSPIIEQTIRSERRRLFDFIRARVRTEQDAEDILQDVFYQLVTSFSVTEPIEKLTSWLFTVARNKIIDLYRRQKFRGSMPSSGKTSDEDGTFSPINLEDILFDPADSPDEVYARSLIWTELAGALDDLPEEQRDVFIMHELQGKSFNDIAGETGEPINTLRSQKHYAVLFLRERLRNLYNEMENI